MHLRDTYNLIAEEWHKDHQTDDWWLEGTDTFISLLQQGDTVLDVGCGGGTKSKYLLEHGLRVTGIDFSEKLLEIARKENKDGEFILMDMYDVKDLHTTFNGIFAQASLLHIPKKDFTTIVSLLVSQLQQDGLLYIAVKISSGKNTQEEIKEENKYGHTYTRFFSYYSMDELIDAYKKSGLEVVYTSSNQTGNKEWLQIIGRK